MQEFWKSLTHHFVPSEHNAYRPHILRHHWLLFFLALSLIAEGFLISNLIMRQSSEQFLAAVVPGEVIALTNSQRAGFQLGTLVENKQLNEAAQAKATDMAQKGYFSHVGPDGAQPWTWIQHSGYNYQYAGENLAARFLDSQDVITAWMASPSHRENVLKPMYTEIGVGVAQGVYLGESTTFVVQYFATPMPFLEPEVATPEPIAAVVAATPSAPVAASTNVAPQAPKVLAAEVSPGPSLTQNIVRSVAQVQAEPLLTTQGILGIVAFILILALLIAFFVHIHIQSAQMLAGGVALVMFVLLLIGANETFLRGEAPSGGQSASSILAGSTVYNGGVILTHEAASIEPYGQR